MASNDHFSAFAATYAQFRPSYPVALFDWLARQAPARHHAWDCATGNGQAARSLAPWFDRVTATDVGEAMITHALPAARVTYRVGSAEDAPIEARSVDLITVAQALHWFDLARFWATCRRVLVPGGVLAFWGYLLPSITPALDAIVDDYHDRAVGPYWPADRGPLLEGYRNITPPPPAQRLITPSLTMSADWTVEQLIGLLDSWSATHRARMATGTDPLSATAIRLRTAWGAATARPVTWPLILHAFRFHADH